MAYIPWTRFEGDTEEAKWNGWENGPGASKGELKTEGKNGYWSGQVNMFDYAKVQPGLRKIFDFEPGTTLYFHFNYRIPSAPSEYFYMTITDPDRLAANQIAVETTTPVNTWVKIQERLLYLPPKKEVWIGFTGSRNLSPFAIEFDDIYFGPKL
ncbi:MULTISPECIES: hypothetical protein [unclassified Pseudomonas]|uniref:hypothetical protein n=1 Tax=unclassified Pseudomonas TaxID=196821 RepID=UPI0008851394|nr:MULTISPECIES: hypothetical protein [unclassified Pseudomonas]SCY87750.1 hypothetical protein SAMN03159391_03547 [Pseudomonas sp. NFACC37-1]SFO32120.1 hypothetical protein SAMN03159304_02787 [Pseudomonas sp. NFACC24-1]